MTARQASFQASGLRTSYETDERKTGHSPEGIISAKVINMLAVICKSEEPEVESHRIISMHSSSMHARNHITNRGTLVRLSSLPLQVYRRRRSFRYCLSSLIGRFLCCVVPEFQDSVVKSEGG
jgi:hypothetical protein